MIGIAVAAFQLAQGTPTLVVRDARHSIRVATQSTTAGPMLRPESLAPIVPVEVRHDSAAWYSIEAWGVHVEVQAGSPIVRVGTELRQMASSPTIAAGRLLVPVQLVSDVFPEFVPNTRWDTGARELVVFSTDFAAPVIEKPAGPGKSRQTYTTSIAYDDARRPPASAKRGRRTVI